MEFKDYYKILGVKDDAETKEIKNAYRKLARKYHPDMNPEPGAADKFKEVAEAYEVLKNQERRAEFDELRRYGGRSGRGFEPPPGWQSSGGSQPGGNQFKGDFSDFFNSIFGGGNRASGHTQGFQQDHYRGQDVEIEMPVFLEETISENTKTIEYLIPGYEDGQVTETRKHLRVKIPLGVMDGERIRLKGQGAPGHGKAEAGDLYLHIRLVPHPLFDVQGHNLIVTVPVAPWEATLGAKVTVPTLEGKINLTITPNSQSGQKLRIKGKGLKGKTVTGDLFAVLNVVVPQNADDKSKQLWRELSTTANFDPRAEWGK